MFVSKIENMKNQIICIVKVYFALELMCIIDIAIMTLLNGQGHFRSEHRGVRSSWTVNGKKNITQDR